MFKISWFYICRLGANFTLEMHIRIVMSLLIALLTVADTKCNEISCVYLRNDNLFGCMILKQELKLLVMRRGIVLCKCFVSLSLTFCFFTFWPEMTFYSVNVEKMKTKIYRNSFLWTHAPHLLDSFVLNKSSNKPLLTSDQIGFGVALIREMRPSHHNVWNLVS